MIQRLLLLVVIGVLALSHPASADDPHQGSEHAASDDKDKEKDKDADKVLAMLPADSTTQHSIALGSGRLSYVATAGTIELRDDKGEASAKVFYVAYTVPGSQAPARPVSFFFNGGPGAASAYLHLGAAGPMVLDFPQGNEADGGAAKLKDNPDTWLPFTDLVFIDAVGTGWSRPAKPSEAKKEFWGVKQDAKAFAKVVALWVEKNGRANAPKYLVGESYGGIRSVMVAKQLQQDQGIILSGIVMVSPAIEMDFVGGSQTNPLPDALRLPSFVAGSLERHHAFAADKVDEAYRYALGEYLTTIVGVPPEGDKAKAFYGRIAQMTEVPEAVVARQRGRLNPQDHEVRVRDGRLYSLYENSLSIADPFPEGGTDEPDPALDGYTRAYGNAMSGYAADNLGYRTELTYTLLSYEVNAAWEWRGDGGGEAPPVGAFDDLRRLLALDPGLRLFVAGGYFDLVCPFEGNRWLIDQLPVGRDRVTFKVYPGGHMLYSRAGSRAALRNDVAGLYPAPSR